MGPSKLKRDGPDPDVEKPRSKPEDGKLAGSAESAVSRSENRGAKKSGAQPPHDRRQTTRAQSLSIPRSRHLTDKLLAAARMHSELSQRVKRKMESRLRTAQQEAAQAKQEAAQAKQGAEQAKQEAAQANKEAAHWKTKHEAEVESSKLSKLKLDELNKQLEDTREMLREEQQKRYDQFYKLRDAQADCELLESYLSKSIVARFHGEPEDGSRLAIEAYKARRKEAKNAESANPPTKEEQGRPDD
ncbi:hypothetical protein MAPG_07829 [Magnaporthiopsis poae ATCC 64411]|uniref:Uncharacterized protein n=1 Tax=Magnaporthiopsis poae (strain ATCC 64411 / 73-15) TaxID=644358 RepID=A0A0C4E5Q5_MAGP6|nr:hypothetical protein MAPG_07829 [Magnaporthiopsis poae ATCC 64411]